LACKALLGLMADDLLSATAAGVREMGIDSLSAVRSAPRPCAAFSRSTQAEVSQLQKFLLDRVYEDPPSAANARRAGQIIAELFAAYVADPARLPQRYQKRVDLPGQSAGADSLHRVACDYIAGMTDRFCRQAHARLAGGAA